MKRTTIAAVLALVSGAAVSNPAAMSAERAEQALARARTAIENDPALQAVPGQILVKFKRGDAQLRAFARNAVNGQLIRELKGVQGLEHLEVRHSLRELRVLVLQLNSSEETTEGEKNRV